MTDPVVEDAAAEAEALYRVWCREWGYDPESAETAAMYEEDWERWVGV